VESMNTSDMQPRSLFLGQRGFKCCMSDARYPQNRDSLMKRLVALSNAMQFACCESRCASRGFYNPIRLHSTLQYVSPVAFEHANELKMG
jgi:transposase InsO family protein